MRDHSETFPPTPNDILPFAADRTRLLPWREVTLTQLSDVTPAMEEVLAALGAFGYSPRDIFGVQLALQEALTNALRHGNRLNPALTVRLRFALTHEDFWSEVLDEGDGFRLAEVADPTGDDQLERCGGRGVFLMRTYMTRVSYNAPGNCVTLYKRRGVRPAG